MSLPEPHDVQDLAPGVQLGHYILMEKLAEGGMGIVYKAFEPALERSVAIKVLLPEYAKNETYVRNFQTEAQVVASLQHPNIVPIYFIGRIHQIAYFSMAYIQGQTLDDWIVNGRRMNLAEARWFMNQAVSALDHASKSNLIHLDIKPSNFLIDSKPMIMLADFGLAQNLSSGETEEREVFGTPYYVSPEQILRQPTDLRTDIYSLGATLFHLTVGQAPFEGETVEQIIEGHLQRPFPLGVALGAGVQLGLIHLMKKMMERDPALRFQNYAELTQALESVETFRYQSPLPEDQEPESNQPPAMLPTGKREMLYGILLPSNAEWARSGGTIDNRFSRNQILAALQNPVRPLSLSKLKGTLSELCSSPAGDLQDLVEATQKFPGYRKMIEALARFLVPDQKEIHPESTETLQWIGLSRARNLALFDFMLTYEWKPSEYFDWKPLWQHQVACGLMIDYLYEALDLKRSGMEFAAGAFHDFGKLIFGELYPLAYFNLMQRSLQEQIPLHQCEEDLFGINHGELAARWMKEIDLPSALIEVVADHENSASPPKKALLRHAVLSVNHLSQQLNLGYSGNGLLQKTPWDSLPSTRILWEARRRLEYTWEEFRNDFPAQFRPFPNLFPS